MNEFWRCALVRMIRTICQTAVATIGSAVVLSDVNWFMVLSASILAGVLSLLTSVSTGLPEVQPADELTTDEVEEFEYDEDEEE